MADAEVYDVLWPKDEQAAERARLATMVKPQFAASTRRGKPNKKPQPFSALSEEADDDEAPPPPLPSRSTKPQI